jgi:hypothetical protein
MTPSAAFTPAPPPIPTAVVERVIQPLSTPQANPNEPPGGHVWCPQCRGSGVYASNPRSISQQRCWQCKGTKVQKLGTQPEVPKVTLPPIPQGYPIDPADRTSLLTPNECPKQPFAVKYYWDGPLGDMPKAYRDYGRETNRSHPKAFVTGERANDDDIAMLQIIAWQRQEIARLSAEVAALLGLPAESAAEPNTTAAPAPV